MRPKNSFAPNAASASLSRQENAVAGGLNLPKTKSDRATANVAARETTVTAPSASVPVADAARATGSASTMTASELPLNGRNVTNLQQLSTAQAQAAASQYDLANKKDLPALKIGRANGQDSTLAEVSGHITDRTGAIVAGGTVTLRDAGGKTRQTITSADGSFHLKELPAGRYELIATASGFKTIEQSIELKPSELAMLQPVLDLGTASEAVTVEAASPTVTVQTESANVGQVVAGRVVTEMPIVGRDVAVLSGLPVVATVSHGARFLSLDSAGNLFLSRNGGRKWKKINPKWTGKAVRVELTPEYGSEAPPKPKNETLGRASEVAVFLLTTDAGTVWISKDGAHWHRQ